jgi:hypothetical protein
MFYCQVLNKLSKPGVKPVRLVIATRNKTYTKWVRNEESKVWEEIEAGRGTEIVKEINASEEGVALYQSWTPEEKEAFAKEI